ncbi:glycosyltransferase family 4 protein [Clostridium sp. OS1-26]|uniref:glycosyltransferase family 4 protein n=1 Tax=Clostridium sp. OS1-26 TaxID=3070681 RepID=UPI0027DEEB08|nr:glycosyltransferase family 4 protein [Clostridium sp. OS1-26]WML35468.1 glycosyltransferase family 4 protein [Clostridium sp. OS1-26]
MNILHITTFLQGGAGRIIKNIASCQEKSENNVYIVASLSDELGYCNYSEYMRELEELKIPCLKIDSTFKRDIYLNLNVAGKLREILIRENIDIIHAHSAVPAMVSIVARSGINKYIPVIQTMHGWGTNKRPEHEKMDIAIINGLDAVVTVSESDKELMIEKGIYKEKLTTIYNGIENQPKDKSIDKDIVDDIFRYKDLGYKIFGCIGTVCKRKNQELVVETVKNLKEKVFCVFIGEGDLLDELSEKIKIYKIEDKIRFYGYRENASLYIKLFDYLIIPSLSEGFGLVIAEGYRENVPVIASNIDVFKEIIEENSTGYLFNNNDENSLKKLIIEANNFGLKNEKTIVENAYRDYKNKFDIDIMIEKYNELYINICEGKYKDFD